MGLCEKVLREIEEPSPNDEQSYDCSEPKRYARLRQRAAVKEPNVERIDAEAELVAAREVDAEMSKDIYVGPDGWLPFGARALPGVG